MFPDSFQTARLSLRPIAPEDAGPIFHAYAQDPDVTRFLTWRPHRQLEDTQAYIAHCVATSSPRCCTYVILGRQETAIRGAIDLRLVEAHRIEFGYVLARAHWGNGLMTEVLREVVLWALAQPRVFRVSAFCDVENTRSARVMEKAGLIREGLLRRWIVHPNISDEPRDCFSYALVR